MSQNRMSPMTLLCLAPSRLPSTRLTTEREKLKRARKRFRASFGEEHATDSIAMSPELIRVRVRHRLIARMMHPIAPRRKEAPPTHAIPVALSLANSTPVKSAVAVAAVHPRVHLHQAKNRRATPAPAAMTAIHHHRVSQQRNIAALTATAAAAAARQAVHTPMPSSISRASTIPIEAVSMMMTTTTRMLLRFFVKIFLIRFQREKSEAQSFAGRCQ